MRNKHLLSLIFLIAFIPSLSVFAVADSTEILTSDITTQAFTSDPVPEEDIDKIVQAGLSSASAMNSQPWYFVVITNQEVMDEINSSMSFGGAPAGIPEGAAIASEEFTGSASAGSAPPEGAPALGDGAGEGNTMPVSPSTGAKAGLGDSPLAILIYADSTTSSTDANFDCGLACQSMAVAAKMLGYGVKIVSSPTMSLNGEKHDSFCEEFGIDTSLSAVGVLLVGKVDESVDGATGATTRDTADGKVSYILSAN